MRSLGVLQKKHRLGQTGMGCWMLVAILAIGIGGVHCEKLEVFMPPHKVVRNDTYLCTSAKLPDEGRRIVAVEPLSDQAVAHHMLMFGCSVPSQKSPEENVWECNMSSPCNDNYLVLYGWGKNAPKLTFPKGVGYSVGGDSSMTHVVLQVHYLSIRPDDDASGVSLTLTKEPSPLAASMMMYATMFSIPPGKESHKVPNTCCLTGFQQLTTMAFRVHTHMMGRSVFMTRASGLYPNGTEIARNDPQLPQGFYPVEEESKIRPGEKLTVTCDYNSVGKDHIVKAGATHADEMCNMYMMVYSEVPHFSSCLGDKNSEFIHGPGGLPADGKLVLESSFTNKWNPPSMSNGEGKGIEGVSGVARADDGNIWMLHRADVHWDSGSFDAGNRYLGSPIDSDVVMELDPYTGSVLRRWGKGLFYMPHFITVDFDGYVWITDTGLHQVLKFNKDGELLMDLGVKLDPGHDNSHFCKPTHVQILNSGAIIVSDGYCNSRVLIFQSDGTFETEIVDDSMAVVHSVLVDECQDSIFMADRENSRVLEYGFDAVKKATVEFNAESKVWALAKGPYDSVLALTWVPNSTAELVAFGGEERMAWEFPIEMDMPHGLAIGAAPVEITGAENRLIAVYVSNTPSGNTFGELHKFILTSKDEENGRSQGEQARIGVMDGHEIIKQSIRDAKPEKGAEDDLGDGLEIGSFTESPNKDEEDLPRGSRTDSSNDSEMESSGSVLVETVVPPPHESSSFLTSANEMPTITTIKMGPIGRDDPHPAIMLSIAPESQPKSGFLIVCIITLCVTYGVFRYVRKRKPRDHIRRID